MRRLLIFAALLSLLGLSTAFAASFTVQSEDIASFTTDVSISVPTTTVPSTPRILYLSGDEATNPGLIAESPPEDHSVNSLSIGCCSTSVQSQITAGKYHSWETAPITVPMTIIGPAVLRTFQNGSIGPIQAGLFVCPATATPTSVGCQQVGTDRSSLGTESSGTEVAISFSFAEATIPVGSTLRLQIVKPTNDNWNIQWGYKSNRESRLEVLVAQP